MYECKKLSSLDLNTYIQLITVSWKYFKVSVKLIKLLCTNDVTDSQISYIRLITPSLTSKREHVTPKHDLIGYQTWHDWSSNISRLADRDANLPDPLHEYFLANMS